MENNNKQIVLLTSGSVGCVPRLDPDKLTWVRNLIDELSWLDQLKHQMDKECNRLDRELKRLRRSGYCRSTMYVQLNRLLTDLSKYWSSLERSPIFESNPLFMEIESFALEASSMIDEMRVLRHEIRREVDSAAA